MSRQPLSIQTLQFDLNFYAKEKAHELHHKISKLYHRQIHQTLNDFFEKAIPENVLIRKNSLLLDLGNIPYELLETEIPVRLEKALQELFPVFTGNTAQHWKEQGFESLPAATAYLDLLEYYLLNGIFPWQASAQQQFTWQGILQELYQHNRSNLAGLFLTAGRQQRVRKRIAYQSAEEEMVMVITTIIPVEAPVILSYQNKIKGIQQEKQLVKADATSFAQSVSFFILTHLLEEKGSLFSQKIFIRSILLQMAAHYNVSYSGLLAVLYEALPLHKVAAQGGSSLFELIYELRQESLEPISSSLGIDRETSALQFSRKITLLKYYLLQGTLPAWSGSVAFTKKELSICLTESIKMAPSTLR